MLHIHTCSLSLVTLIYVIIDGSSYEICNDDRCGSILVWLMDKIVNIYKVLIAKLMSS